MPEIWPFIQKLGEHGIISILLVVSLWVNYTLYIEVKNSQEKRIEEAHETKNLLIEPIAAIKETVKLILETVTVRGRR